MTFVSLIVFILQNLGYSVHIHTHTYIYMLGCAVLLCLVCLFDLACLYEM